MKPAAAKPEEGKGEPKDPKHVSRHQVDAIKKEMSFDPKDSKEVAMAKLQALKATNETLT